jgi:hypothetical protein
MAFTYSKLAEVTVGSGGTPSIDFTNIPQNYTDLVLKLSLRCTTVAGYELARMKLKINSFTSSYTNRLAYLIYNTLGSEASVTDSISYFYATGDAATSSIFASTDIYLPNYSGSANKSASIDTATENNATNAGMAITAGLLSNTSPITALSITSSDGFTIAQHSTASLYGIRGTEY